MRPWPPSVGAAVDAAPVVDDLESQARPARSRRRTVAVRRPGVLQHVGQRLLHDAVGGEVDAGRQLVARALDAHVDVEARRRRRRDEPVEVGEARRGLRTRAPLVVAQHAEHAADLGRASSGSSCEIASSDFFASAGSVSITCAPTPACTAITPIECATTSCSSCAMRSRSSATARLASSSRSRLERVGALLELLAVEAAVAHRRAEEVRGGEERDVERDVGAVRVRDADDRRRSASADARSHATPMTRSRAAQYAADRVDADEQHLRRQRSRLVLERRRAATTHADR